MKRISVGVLGATGIVGQAYVRALVNHPYFELQFLSAGESSLGRQYGQLISGDDLPQAFLEQELESASKAKVNLLFSALPTSAALVVEEELARCGKGIISSSSAFRTRRDVPLLVPEINAHALDGLQRQGFGRGFIVAKPNCAVHGLLLALYPLHREFGLQELSVTTMQALSGAGKNGPCALDMVDNLLPYIEGEEEKFAIEPQKILGLTSLKISAHCNRVAVLDGHTACVSARFERRPELKETLRLWQEFQGLDLPSSPKPLIYICDDPTRPQPRLDRGRGGGMAISVGRVRPCPLFDLRFVTLSQNAVRGAAGGGLLIAELLYKQGRL